MEMKRKRQMMVFKPKIQKVSAQQQNLKKILEQREKGKTQQLHLKKMIRNIQMGILKAKVQTEMDQKHH